MEPPHVPPVVDALQARSCPTPPCSPSATDAAITCTMTSGEDNTTVADAYDGTDAPGTSQKALIVDDEYRDGDGYASADQIDMNYSDIEKGDYTPVFHVNPPAVTPERFRDFRGPFTIHRFISFAWVLGVCVSLYFIQRLIWPPDALDSPYRNSWIANPYLGLILFIALPSSILSFIGAIWFRYNPNLDKVQPMEHNVVFRIVSRGINQECLLETIRCCQQEMRRNAYFPYLIEVVTDADVFEAPDEPDVIHLRVPPSYVTQNDTRFKARALNYACEYSLVPGNSWLVHLDEETRPTSSAIKGIAAMVADCERRGDITRIGQGCILYHRAFMQHKFLTLADSRRTGDDFGHFFLQHRIGVTMFGLHGAFIVCRQDTEAKLGFDIGPKGSITEDAWWILLAMKQGYRTAWVDGFLDEQATQVCWASPFDSFGIAIAIFHLLYRFALRFYARCILSSLCSSCVATWLQQAEKPRTA